jgi:Protein of unknown function (DUF3990)
MPILNPAPPWTAPRDQYLVLWHGCTSDDKNKIEAHGVDVTRGREATDFGRGFYTTTNEVQARHWAWIRYYDPKFSRATGVQPVVLRFRVNRHDLAKLQSICFFLGDYGNEDYWSIVQHCRQSTATAINDHHGPVVERGLKWYDIACGPVAAFWEQRRAMTDTDQVSFHTDAAAKLLTALIRSGNVSEYSWHPVV